MLYPCTLFLLSIALILLNDSRLSFTAIVILLRQAAILGLLCIGLGVVVLAGGIDLSVGAILSLSSGICSSVLIRHPNAVLPAVLLSLAACTLCGLLNGILITHFNFPTAIITFSQALVFAGLSSFFNSWISDRIVPPLFYRVFNGTIYGIPTSACAWFLLLALVSLILRYTYWGQYIYAIGENEQALCSIGVNTKRYRVATYACCGLFAGLAGVFMLARVSVATSSVNTPLVLNTLTAISLGGIGFSNSYGKLPDLLFGTLTLAAVSMCMTIYAIPTNLQNLSIALLFLLSLWVGQVVHSSRTGELDSELI